MRIFTNHYFILAIIFTANSIFCFGQKTEFIRLGVNENLSQNSVHHFLQDKQGFIWIATGDGLNRYDGRNFKHYRHRYGDTTSSSIPANFIKGGLIEDLHDNIWMATGPYLTRFDKKTEQFLVVDTFTASTATTEPPLPAWHIAGIVNNELWYAAANGRLICYNLQQNKKQVFAGRAFSSPIFVALHQNYIFIVGENIFDRFNTITKKYEHNFIEGEYISVKTFSDNRFACLGSKEMALYQTDGKLIKKISLKDVNPLQYPVINIIESNNNEAYLSIYLEGLIHLNLLTEEKVKYKNEPGNIYSISSNLIHCLYIDRSQNLWIGTEGGGINRLNLKPAKFGSFPTPSQNMLESANLMVKSLYRSDSLLYAGTFDKGLYKINIHTGALQQVRYPQLEAITSPFSINVLYKDLSGRLWMNVGNIIGYINPATGQFIKKTTIHRSNIKGNHAVFSILEKTKNSFLVGTNYGLYSMTVNNGDITIDKELPIHGHVQTMAALPDNSIMLGMINDGYKRIQLSGAHIRILDSGMATSGIRHILPYKQNLAWMSSDDGLIAYNPVNHKMRIWNEADGLSNSHVYAVLPYDSNQIWLSTNKGLNRVEYSMVNDSIQINQVTAYQQKDGLQSNEFNSGAFFMCNGVEYFFGGVTGINWFNPGKLNINRFAPQPVITGIYLFDKPIQTDTAANYLHSLQFDYKSNVLTLHFAALEFSNPQANQFAYMLKGFDKDWIYTSSPSVRYSRLPPGNYTFLLKAANNDGVWCTAPAQLNISIAPPFWKTWWFILLCIGIALALLFFAVKLIIKSRVKKQLRQQELQLAVNEERLRISKDMHDEMGTSLTKISLLSEVTRKSLSGSEKEEKLLGEITSTSRSLTEKMGEIIWTLNPKNDTLDNLCAYLKEYIFETTDNLPLEIKTDFPAQVANIKLTHKQRQQLLLVTKEALHNAIKHSGANEIKFGLHPSQKDIRFFLSDNGKGFAPLTASQKTIGKKGNGVQNMQNRMEQAGGFLNLQSSDMGTIVEYGIIL